MKLSFPALGGFLLVPFLCLAWQQNSAEHEFQQQPDEAVSSETTSAPQGKNPVKPTPENLAEVRERKGDLAASMGLKMNDWHEASTLAAKSDGEIFDLIVEGKGKMTGGGDRISAEMACKLVNYVRSRRTSLPLFPKPGRRAETASACAE